jgi:hypothetical protein
MIKELKFLDLDKRHAGLTASIAGGYAEAASVCLDRHHEPKANFKVQDSSLSYEFAADWPKPDHRVKAAWKNEIDTTESGAYAIALASMEETRGLVAIARAETATGADYYIHTPGRTTEDIETSTRLEVSGTDKGDFPVIKRRLEQKIKQAKQGNSNRPACACVIGFAELLILQGDAT